jgi:hypothetical protein
MAVAATFSLNIPSGFIVRGDAAATANKIASSQLFYRLCIVSDLASQILFVFLVLVLYQLLKGVNKRQAALMVHWFSFRFRWHLPICSWGWFHSYC